MSGFSAVSLDFGDIFGAGASIFNNVFNAHQNDKTNQRNRDLQREINKANIEAQERINQANIDAQLRINQENRDFAREENEATREMERNALSIRTKDAVNAGSSPLAALDTGAAQVSSPLNAQGQAPVSQAARQEMIPENAFQMDLSGLIAVLNSSAERRSQEKIAKLQAKTSADNAALAARTSQYHSVKYSICRAYRTS